MSALPSIFITFKHRKLPDLLFYVDIMIGKALFKHFYISYASLILCKHGNVVLSLTLKETQFQPCLLHTCCRNTYQGI